MTAFSVSPTMAKRNGKALSWAIFWVLAALLIVLVVVPFNPHIVGTNELDYSWMLALHVTHANSAVWGKDVVYTYGPLGYLVSPVYYPDTFVALILCRIALVACLLLVFFYIVRKSFNNVGRAALWSIILILLLATDCNSNWSGDVIPAFFVAAALVMQFDFPDPPIVPICLSMAMLALLSLAKESYFPIAAMVCSAICLDLLLTRRFIYCALVIICFFLAMLGGWTLLGHQRLNDLGSFVATTMEIVRGYPQAMAYGAPGLSTIHEKMPYGLVKLTVTCIIALFGISVVGIAAWKQADRPKRGWMGVAAITALIFVIFKATCVRLDQPHLVPGIAALLVFLLIYAPAAGWNRGASRAAVRTLFVAMLAIFVVAVGNLPADGMVTYPWQTAQETFASARAAIGLAMHGTAHLRTAYENHMSDIRASVPGVQRGGNVDVYPWDNALAIALSQHYHPRPIFQSYQAYTPTLADINARHFYSADAPDRVLLNINPIDGRFPNLDDCLSWPVLLARYEPVGIAGVYAVLRRRGSPLDSTLTPLSQRVVSMNEWIPLPRTDSLLWAQMDIAPSAWGRIQAALVRPAVLTLFVGQAHGVVIAYRMIPLLAKAGFLLSPTIRRPSAFISLANAVSAGPIPTTLPPNIAIKLTAADNWSRLCFSTQWTLRLSTLAFHIDNHSPAER